MCLFVYDVSSKVVFDLGYGSGLWSTKLRNSGLPVHVYVRGMSTWAKHPLQDLIKTTQGAAAIGFDKRKVQPDLKRITLGAEYRDLSRRGRWMDLRRLVRTCLPSLYDNTCVTSLWF